MFAAPSDSFALRRRSRPPRAVDVRGTSLALGGAAQDCAGGFMRRAIVLVLAFTFAACSNNEKPEDGIREDGAAIGVATCSDLEDTVKRQATRDMNAQIDELIASLDRSNGGNGSPTLVSVPAAAPQPSNEPRDSAADFTTTNVQEAGVDEPDFVKNDGSRIFVLNGRNLLALTAWPPERTGLESTTVIEGQPSQMLLYKDRVVVFSNVYVSSLRSGTPSLGIVPYPYNPGNAVKVTALDVSSSVPRVVHEQYLEGHYLSARRTDSSVRIVTGAPARGPALRYWPEGDVDWSRKASARAALERLRSENQKAIKSAPLSDWLPRVLTSEGGSLHEMDRPCSSFFATNVPARLGFTTVSTLDLDGLATDHTTILNAVDQVYASLDSLYLAMNHYWFSPTSETQVREDHTYVFKLDTGSDKRHVRYVAAGGVPGTIVNSFALDEEAGSLRVATTRRTWLGWQLKAMSNSVVVLRASGDRLSQVGEVDDLAHNERIYSARFEGPRGFLVTFRNVDPLFTLDVSNPSAPRVVGELKVPGFSTYLHPIGPSHLLTVGRDTTGAQLQIFNVADFANPTLQHRYVLGSSSSSSEAEYDHKAFTYFASRGLLSIPLSDWTTARRTRFTSSLAVLRATPDAGIVPLGFVEHADLVQGTDTRGYLNWSPQVRRSVMMEDYVYSISYGGLKVNDVRELTRTVATVPFPN
jgi:uncharacterized secreted protein with C-terminal beta-propeller domain